MKPNELEPNLLDRVIAFVAPRLAYRRMASRAALNQAKAYWEGAKRGRRGNSIRRSSADINVMSERDLPNLRTGSRDLAMNNPHAKRGIEAIVSETVGTGVRPYFMRGENEAAEIMPHARAHLFTTQCDAWGKLNIFGIQALAMRTLVESGEVLIRRRYRRSADPIPVPVTYQVLEPDHLDEGRDGPQPNGGRIVQGVEFDAIGRIRGYWMYREHPGSNRLSWKSDFVPARDIIHAFRVDRPGQARGIPWLAPVMLRLADFSDYEEAHLVRQKIAACFVGFIRETFERDVGPPPGASADEDGNVIDTIYPGAVERLPPGTDIEFGSPPAVEGYGEYSQVSLRAIAAGLGISYESLTGDLRNVNFSSGKMGRLQMERNVQQWQQHILVPQLLHPMLEWFLEAVMLKHGIDTTNVEPQFVMPERAMIDPTRERKAQRDAIRAGQITFTQAITGSGRDPRAHFEEFARDLELLDELDITVDADPRVRTQQGQAIFVQNPEDGGDA